MALTLLKTDDTTPVSDLAITNFDAGADSDTLTMHLWNNSGSTVYNILLIQQTESRTVSGLYLAAGVPPQDEYWGRLKISGYDNAGDASWSVGNTDFQPMGAYSGLLVASIPDGCAVYLQWKGHPPSTASELQWRIQLAWVADEHSQPAPPYASKADRGVLHGIGDAARSGIVSSCAVTATGTPDDYVHVAAGFWLHKGIYLGKIVSDHQLNQNDVTPAALASGESYYATLSLGASGVTVTKGTKAVSPTKPAVPAGELFLKWALVEYQAGGTSVIETADLSGETLYDRYAFSDDGALAASLFPGESLGGSTWRYSAIKQSLGNLTDDDVNYVWILNSGLPQVELTGVAPEAGATLLFEITTASGDITQEVDRRSYAGDTVLYHLRGDAPASPGEVVSKLIEHEHLFLEAVVYRISDNGGGAAGSTILDSNVNGTTIYTGQATEDHRPTWAYNASVLTFSGGVHEVTEVWAGDVLSLDADAYPDSDTSPPTWVEAYYIFRKP